MRTGRPAILALCVLLLTLAATGAVVARDLTFIVVSDTHYGRSPEGDRALSLLVDGMNQLPGIPYPATVGGTVGKPCGVIHIGDITNDGKKTQWEMFVRDYGLNGKDGRLVWPVYETFGNHDGGEKLPVRTGIRERNKKRAGLTGVSENGLHYSWDWDGIHFVNCGIAPGTTTHPYDPEHSFEFLENDLKKNVGPVGRPVILLHHFGFDKEHSLSWWPEAWRTTYHDLIKGYDVMAILHGHAHQPFIYQWEGIDVYHPPHLQGDPKKKEPVTHGFFVFHITDNELTVAERKLDGTWGMTARKPLRTPASVPTAVPTATVAVVAPTVSPARDVTFISTSDSHYREPDHKLGHHNDLNRASLEEMNRITGTAWPDKLGGGKIAVPRGVVVLGDLIDDGDRGTPARNISREQYGLFLADFGLDGTDGLLKYPVFEGWGNHDEPPEGKEKCGFSSQGQIRQRNQLRKQKGLISNLSNNGLHYSWDWDDIHFVQLNLYPADKQHASVHYAPVWHDPQAALTFLKKDLAEKVGDSGRPVVLMSHCGFDTDWWVKSDWEETYAAAKAYNVVLYLYGHSGTGVLRWAPEGEAKKWDCINDGHTDAGFFVIQITGGKLRAAYRYKSGLKFTKAADGSMHHEWDGAWKWKFLLEKRLAYGLSKRTLTGPSRPETGEPRYFVGTVQ